MTAPPHPELQWRGMTVGSLPHTDPLAAWNATLRHLPETPTWPQLPRRSFLENMYVQYSERFPGVVLDMEAEKIQVDRERDLTPELEQLYMAEIENDIGYGAVSDEYAAGLAALMRGKVKLDSNGLISLKGQVTGPISWGLTVTDTALRPVLYDDTLADALVRHLRLKMRWQIEMLSRHSPLVIAFLDEPYLASYGSAYVALSREQAIELLESVVKGLPGMIGLHCCGNTEWPIPLSTSIDIINLDAYGYADSFALYPEEVSAFLERGGWIAWGIVPSQDEEAIARETVESLVKRLHEAIDKLVEKGVDRDAIMQASFVTPSCGMGTVSVPAAERVIELLAGVSEFMRKEYT